MRSLPGFDRFVVENAYVVDELATDLVRAAIRLGMPAKDFTYDGSKGGTVLKVEFSSAVTLDAVSRLAGELVTMGRGVSSSGRTLSVRQRP